MDMRFYWIRNCVKQGHYNVYWKPGKFNKADYVTKITHLPNILKNGQHIFINPTIQYPYCEGVLIILIMINVSANDVSPIIS